MANNNEHILNYSKIEEDPTDTRHGLDLLQQNVREQLPYLDEDIRPVSAQAEEKDSHNGINFELPGNIAFRVEDNRIIFSEFGMSKEELKTVYKFLATMGFTGLSVPDNEDEPFKEKIREAYEDMADVDGMFVSNAFDGMSENQGQDSENQNTRPAAANSNTPAAPENSGNMTDEERLRYTREIAENLRTSVRPKPLPETPKKVHPCVEDISNYIDSFVTNTQKYKSNNYRKRSRANGWEVMVYKDADQKKEGPTADKKGKINPNFEFGLRGEIVKKNGKPHLQMTFLTPKYGDMADWMFDEVMNMADECKITHIKFGAGMQHKSKFFTACGKKLIIPTGIKLKVKDIDGIYKAAQLNNDDPAKRAAYYLRLAEQLEENMRNEKITNEAHPFVEWAKKLRDEAKNEAETNKAKVKYKKFNQFFENNIMGKIYPDDSNNPIPAVNTQGIETDAVKQLATGRAYVELLAMYRDNEEFAKASDEAKKEKYMELYNKNIYLYDKKLDEAVGGISDKTPTDRKNKKDLIKDEYDIVNSDIKSLTSSLKNDLGVDVESPDLIRRSYDRHEDADGNRINPNERRIAKGRAIVEGYNHNLPGRSNSNSGR